jgi:hypothetical protein
MTQSGVHAQADIEEQPTLHATRSRPQLSIDVPEEDAELEPAPEQQQQQQQHAADGAQVCLYHFFCCMLDLSLMDQHEQRCDA